MAIVIDADFKKLIPPLTAEEYAGLEQSLLQDGCRDALVLWGDTLVDGHNRYEICIKHGIPFQTVQKDFTDRNAVIVWMIQNQLARRNLPAYERARLALRLKPVVEAQAKERQGTRTDLKDNIPPKLAECSETRDIVARAAGVSHGTLAKVEVLEKSATPEVKQQLRSGEMSINQAYKQVKQKAKKAEIKEAKKAVAEQTKADPDAPILFIGDSIGLKTKEPVDLLLTDPPYSTEVENIDEFAARWLPTALNNVRDTGFAYVFIGAYPAELKAYLNVDIPQRMKLEQVLCWTYRNTLGNNPKDRYKLNYQAILFFRGENAPALDCPLTSEQWAVQDINAPDGRQGDRYHTWQKPMEIAERFIRHSTKPGMTVYDPFACTGTFLLAASKLGRKAFGYEIDGENAKIAFDRGCVQG